MSPPPAAAVYGPVPSRRLGRSLGIDLIPFKICSYDCLYCQLGRTTHRTLERRPYVPVDGIPGQVAEALAAGASPDWIALAGSGEPTLHDGIGSVIRAIGGVTDVPVAVITNGSLLWRPDVRADLARARLVIPSLDAGSERTFRRVNRPAPDLPFDRMVEGLVAFSRGFEGAIWLEVLLVGGVTDTEDEVRAIARIAERIRLAKVQVGTVERPPGGRGARGVPRERLAELAGLFSLPTEVIAPREEAGNSSGRIPDAEGILSLLARRPCTVRGIADGLGLHPNDVLKHLDDLVARGAVRPRRRGRAVWYERARLPAEGDPVMSMRS